MRQLIVPYPLTYLENVINIRHCVPTRALVVIFIELQLLYALKLLAS